MRSSRITYRITYRIYEYITYLPFSLRIYNNWPIVRTQLAFCTRNNLSVCFATIISLVQTRAATNVSKGIIGHEGNSWFPDSYLQESLLGVKTTRVFVVVGPRWRGEFHELRIDRNRSRCGGSLQLQSARDVAAECDCGRGFLAASSTPLG